MPCPSDDDLNAYLAGSVDPGLAAQIRSHLPDCRDCALVVELADEHATLPQAPAEGPARAGASVGTFVLQRQIGEGGMGVVWEAYDPDLDRMVALKLMRTADPALARRFAREMRITARLQHPGIVAIFDAGTHAGATPYYVMRRVSGDSLAALVAARPQLADRLALVPSLLAAIDAVAYAHRARVVHRDLKLENILVGEHGESVVIDWGLAKALDDSQTTDTDDPYRASRSSGQTLAGSVLGTPAYMPPEQARGEAVDATADVYALGAMLYALVTGRRPYADHASADVVAAVIAGPPAPLPAADVPPELATIIARAMARDPKARYASAAELAAELRRYTAGERVASHQYSPGSLARRWLGRHRAAVTVGALALVAVGALLVLTFTRGEERAVTSAPPPRGDDFTRNQVPVVVGAAVGRPTLSPDATRVAYATPNTVVIRTLATGETHEVESPSSVTSIRWSPRSDQLAIAEQDGPRLVDASGKLIRTFAAGGFLCKVAWSPDATELLWHCGEDRAFTVITIATGATKPLVIPLPESTILTIDWAPAGIALGVMGKPRASVWIVPSSTHLLRQLAEEDMVSTVRWSSDGTRVYYVRPHEPGIEIVAVNATGAPEAPEVILSESQSQIGVGDMFAFSADERSLLVLQQRHLSDVMSHALDAAPPRPLTTDHQQKHFVTVAPDGTWLVFATQVDDKRHLYRLALAGGEPTALPIPPSDHGPGAISPDAAALAMLGYNAAGAQVVRVADVATGAMKEFPVPHVTTGFLGWLDARSVLAGPIDTKDLLVVAAETGAQRSLLAREPRAALFRAAVSADGKHLAALIVLKPGTSQLVAIDIPGGAERIVAPVSTARPIGWSDDGKWIYVKEEPPDDERLRILAIRADGSGASRLLAVVPAGEWPRVLPGERGLVWLQQTEITDLWFGNVDRKPDVVRGSPSAAPAALPTTPALANLALGGTPGSAPPDWEVIGGASAALVTSECGRAGPCVVVDGAVEGGLLQRVEATPYRGHRVRVSADAKVVDADCRIGMNNLIYTRSKLPAGRTSIPVQDWGRQSFTADVAPDAVAVELKVLVDGPGKCWLRDLAVEVLP